MRKLIIALALAIASMPVHAAEPAQVLLLGTFHFQDPGLDKVKANEFNIFTADSQQYLEGLTTRLAEFKPTRVLLEYAPENDETINQRYRDYLDDDFELPANEIYQLGFRVARKAGLERVDTFDHREVSWDAEPLFEYGKTHDSPELVALEQMLAEHTAEENAARASMDLGSLLLRENEPGRDRANMNLYLLTNVVGAGEGWEGANAASSWWERNFRMYAIIQRHAQSGERVLAIGGSGHVAILRTLLEIDQRRQAVPVKPLLEP